MEVYVYADVLFGLNCLADMLILYITGKIFKKKPRFFRLFFGAVFASALYIVVFTVRLTSLLESAVLFAACLGGGIYISFFPVKPKEFFALALGAVTVSCALGGGCLALYFFAGFPEAGIGLGFGSVSFLFLAGVIIVVFAPVRAVFTKARSNAINKQVFYIVGVSFNGGSVRINGLVDTGSSLVEPISGKPVIVAELNALRPILPEGVCSLFAEKREHDLLRVFEVLSSSGMYERVRMIPYKGMGADNGMMIGFRPDIAGLFRDGTEEFDSKDIIIGIYNGSLSGGGYQALINPAVLHN